jgi:hypothetical protein
MKKSSSGNINSVWIKANIFRISIVDPAISIPSIPQKLLL